MVAGPAWVPGAGEEVGAVPALFCEGLKPFFEVFCLGLKKTNIQVGLRSRVKVRGYASWVKGHRLWSWVKVQSQGLWVVG